MKKLIIYFTFLSLLLMVGNSYAQYNVTGNLVVSNSSTEAVNLHQFLKNNYGKKIISGQTEAQSDFDKIKNVTGSYPLLRGYDMQPYSPMYSYSWANGGFAFGPDNSNPNVQNAINWYNNNGKKPIIQFQWHWHSPSGGTVGTNTFYTQYTTFDVSRAVNSSTQEYKDVIRDIDAIAVQLKKLRDAGVPVIWRPLHEAGGTWFWWSAKGSDNYKKLWDIVYDRIVNYHGIRNLIWAWTGNDAAWYPGNAKVDILGIDSYPGNFNYTNNKVEFDKNYNICGGTKLVAMTENGPIPDINSSLNGSAPWSYFMSWNEVQIGNSDQHLRDVFSNANVITLENVNYSTCAITAITPYVQVNGGTWTQTGTATVASGTKVVIGPQPSSGGSWSWNGGCGTSGTTREQTIYPTGDCDIIATYTNSCGAKSTYTFQIRISGPTSALVSGGVYQIIARHSGKSLDIKGNSTANGALLEQWTYGGGTNQQFVITDVGSGAYRISPTSNTSMAFDLKGWSTADGDSIDQWTYSGGNNQKWQLVASGSYYSIKSVHSGKCLDVRSAATTDGAVLVQWTCGSATNQQFTFTLIRNSLRVATQEIEAEAVEMETNSPTRIYPNPSHDGKFTIQLHGASTAEVGLYDMHGKALFKKSITGPVVEINPGLVSGMYLLKIEEQGKVKTSKIIIR